MHRIASIDFHSLKLARRIDLGRTLVAVVVIGLIPLIIGSLVVNAAVRADITPDFNLRITLDAQHSLVIHNGPSPTCTVIPNPPQHDCFRPGPERRLFSVDLLTPHKSQSLVWFRLPPR
ncbi:MAG TPA: hypothetical protein VFX76_18365 [Roseiflexaceae bacterium]|nr:hypothetical protein [Roseiflexaceae bacterium]